MADFTWTPSVGFTTETTPRVSSAKFGDGYQQRVLNGINTIEQIWNVQFQSQDLVTAAEIDSFLSSKQGATSFTWIPPGEYTEVKVICMKWSKTYDSSISRSISATFERVYE